MNLSHAELLRYGVNLALEAGVCGLALRRGLYRRFRLFTLYLLAIVLCEIVRWIPILAYGLRSRGALWAYWGTQGALLVLRGAVVFEICYLLLRAYPGVWKLAKDFLMLVALGLGTTAFLAPKQEGPHVAGVILTAERGLELAIVGLLVMALAFCRYYRIPVDRLTGMVALGLGLYSTIQIVNNSFLTYRIVDYFRWWAEIRLDSYALASLTWLAVLWRPLPAPRRAPALLDPGIYSSMAPKVTGRLRDLNARLEEILK